MDACLNMLRVACIQMRSGVEVAPNIEAAAKLVREAAADGASFVATPEMTNILDIRPGMARAKMTSEAEDATLAAMRALAAELGVSILLGSIAVVLPDDARLANRSILIGPDGGIIARYDKIHMFDVDVGDGQSYRESNAYRAGADKVLADARFAKLGMTICYDLRFPHLYRSLAKQGAEILSVPAAFTRVTGKAHWHVLLRARAIETGCFVIAPAQGGRHEDGRETFGHSLIVSPWGDVLAEATGDTPRFVCADIDLGEVTKARLRIPSLARD